MLKNLKTMSKMRKKQSSMSLYTEKPLQSFSNSLQMTMTLTYPKCPQINTQRLTNSIVLLSSQDHSSFRSLSNAPKSTLSGSVSSQYLKIYQRRFRDLQGSNLSYLVSGQSSSLRLSSNARMKLSFSTLLRRTF